MTEVRLSFPRLRARLDALAEIGAFAPGGVARLALTDADKEARDLVVTWMHDLGLRVDVDGIGNIVGTWPAHRQEPAVLTGSHVDSVATGGIYDGALGVLAGLEVIEAVATSGLETARPLAVGVFTDEEGSRFAPDMLGSLVYVGGLALEPALDTRAVDGSVLRDELERIGYAGSSPCPAVPPHAFVELHVEQGPVLEAEGVDIGVVTGVQGISWTELTVTGQSNHAGTTPMSHRHDAGLVAAEIAVGMRALADEIGPPMVATVGRAELHPNLVNVVAARATLTVDLRHTDDAVLTAAETALTTLCDELCAREGVTIAARSLARFAPVQFDDAVVDLVERVAPRRVARRGAWPRAPVTTRRCWRGCVPPAWCSCPAQVA